MIRKQFFLALTLLLFHGLVAAGDPFAGEQLYQQHCQHCHAADGTGVAGTPPLDRNALMQSDNQLLQVLQQGKGTMPAYLGLLDEEQLRDVIAYMRTMP